MSELEALRWAEGLGEPVVLEWTQDEDAGKYRWFVFVRGRQAWGDRLVDALVAIRAAVEAKA